MAWQAPGRPAVIEGEFGYEGLVIDSSIPAKASAFRAYCIERQIPGDGSELNNPFRFRTQSVWFGPVLFICVIES